ncbi:conidial pigment biosynthesis 1,3,6,8-tetrahydroxynaphthalene reductase Arp2 [Talaromyces stipitatus ATCC 10500]|uniref:Conidial pigment biosynthesis 1,3,6,8-tetrahydroxynaphthalene reductase Arp2 n=1 Tax=Talaromyces stipitatus (strain ATCC 10500 / CBS 375.48 / QM 6759 / NRRL 1006) TaxID=441959 RepID=B8MBM2_TALSN|nr:conidial pigment biosynthesis 1,3,6,8-tetrahydroxynaphthalene reductase Arp2 [Talaromyces stipitatus ATCC 10500]EED17886.1 conidial pigment biosynthesis 1,3,6,8-tetrahydroxynaphthalene reductase Arp2 [Talaromyces stipitatus ATCC 10500]
MIASSNSTNDNACHATPRTLLGKVALVTGGGRGIGAGIALELAKRGAYVAINYSSSASSANQIIQSIEAEGSRGAAFKADVTKIEEIESLFNSVHRYFGRIDIVVSNAGVEKFKPLSETALEDFNEVFNINTRGQFFVAKTAHKHIEQGGRVILMSSIAAGVSVPGHALYAGSKSAIEGFTRCFAADFGEKRCTVNAIAPAGIKSDMWLANAWRYAAGCDKTSSLEEIETALANGSPLKRCGVPADIGRVVCFLASPDGEWINGQTIPVNGGANI